MASLFTHRRRTPTWLIHLGHRLEAGLVDLLWWLSRRISPARAAALGGFLFGALGPRSRKHRWVQANLRVAFPTHSRAEIQTLGRGVWQHFGATVLEYPHLSTLARDGMEIFHPHGDPGWLKQPGPWIFVGAHLGNNDLIAYAVRQLGIPTDSVYSPLANPHLDRALQGWRQLEGIGWLPKDGALRSLVRSLKAGHSVGLVVDVRADEAPLSPFFGVDASTTEVPAWLSRRFGCPIVPVQALRMAGGHFRVVFHPPLPVSHHHDDARAIAEQTVTMNQAIAGMIAENPEQWWCGKRRWPRSAYQNHSTRAIKHPEKDDDIKIISG